MCKSGSTPLRLDPGLYYVKDVKEKDVLLGRKHFEVGAGFVSEYPECGCALSVHRDNPNDNRHHAFYIDVVEMLGLEAFAQKYSDLLDELEYRPQVILSPDHSAGREMGGLAAERLGGVHIVFDSLRGQLPPNEVEALRDAEHLLIVDDVLISGSRLTAYTTALRERADLFRGFASVTFLVGIGRPRNKEEWEVCATKLTTHAPWKASLLAVERLYLPNWEARDCPWCQEHEFLSELAHRSAEPPSWLSDRIALLTERERGVRETPLLLLPDVSDQVLGDGSLAGPAGLSSMCTLFSVASALEALRSDRKETTRLDPSFPASQVFGLKNLENYSEGLLRAILLRSVKPQEWGIAAQRELEERLGQYGRSTDQGLLLGEALLSVWRRAVTTTAIDRLADPLRERLGDSYTHVHDCLLD